MTLRRSLIAVWAASLALAALALGPLVDRSDAFIYWANSNGAQLNGTTLGRANLDGTGVDESFISGASGPCGVTVTDTSIYWGNDLGATGTTIGRANIDGSGVNQSFVSGASGPCVGDVDSTYLYWTNFGSNTVGRATLDGVTVDNSFVNPADSLPCMAAVNDSSVYWANQDGNAIGRAQITGANPNSTFLALTSGDDPCGIADNSAHIYWANFDNNTIGRANLDGSGLDDTFITGASKPCGVAVTDTHIYWGNSFNGTIGRANLDGSGVDQSFITGTGDPCGIAVDDNVRPSSMSLACAVPQAAFNQPTICTATVTDTGPAPTRTSPAGTVSFASASPGAAYAGPSSCTLAPAATGTSRCSVTYLPGGGINLLQGTYGGDPDAHAGGSAVARITVSSMSLGAVTLNRKTGTATLPVTVPGAGTVSLSGAGLQPASAQAGAAGSLTLPIVPDQPTADGLWKTGTAPVAGIVTFTPRGGGRVDNQPFSLTLQKQLRKPRKHHKKHKKHKKKGHHKSVTEAGARRGAPAPATRRHPGRAAP